ncbi:DUF4870 domain-containing protein [Agilicoccus flavus]|uniref:DUF4870 domain-containing protein n=1 Tax=Agilicoccus flavus TaxID=2775968 RepID=UPI001CF62F49|nr:DUF4870 domain-containing protein [Agilicoccus flavus]
MSYPPHPPQGSGPPPPNPYGRGPGGPREVVRPEDRSMALIAHLSTIASMIISVGWLSFVGPLVVWFLYKNKSRFVRESAAGAFNFNLSMWLIAMVGWVCVLTIIGAVVGIPLLIFSGVAQIVCHVIGAMKANRGELYRYPFQLRILS